MITALVKKVISAKNRAGARLWNDSATRAYIRRNQEKYPQDYPKNAGAIVLIDLFEEYLSVHTYAQVGNFLARKHRARMEYFYFAQSSMKKLGWFHRRLKAVFRSFGVQGGLTLSGTKRFKVEAEDYARTTISGLKSKNDVVAIKLKGIRIGDLVYQTCLCNQHETIDLADHSGSLFTALRDAFLMHKACELYFDKHDVKSVIVSHTVYTQYGIITRVAARRNVPVYRIVTMGWRKDEEISLMRVDPENNFMMWPYWKYHEIFSRFTAEEQEARRIEGKACLEAWLEGKSTRLGGTSILKGRNSWMASGAQPALEPGPRPKIVVLMNSFYDGPHVFRNMLFPDLWEWILYTLAKAADTPFDWYVKPHPLSIPRNYVLNEELKRRFPKVKFLSQDASNRQIVEEGAAAIFSVFGSAIHEFPYFNVPVVAAGDSFPANYDFYLKPASLEEYERCIANADKLKVNIVRSELEEFTYMNYLHFYRNNRHKARPLPDDVEKFLFDKCAGLSSNPRLLAYLLENESKDRDDRMRSYMSDFFSEQCE